MRLSSYTQRRAVMDFEAGRVVSFESAVKVIEQWSSRVANKQSMFDGSHDGDMDEYLRAVDEIRRSKEWAITATDDEQQRLQTMEKSAIQTAVFCLEYEFTNILKESYNGVQWPSYSSSSSDSNLTGFEMYDYYYQSLMCDATMNNLRNIAERMDSDGLLLRCVRARGALLNFRFRQLFLNVEKLSNLDIRRLDYDDFQFKIKEWILAATVWVRVVFVKEKQLCQHIFEGLQTESASAWLSETMRDCADRLLNFVEAVIMVRPLPARLFMVLDLRRTLKELSPDLNALYQSNSLVTIRCRATDLLLKLDTYIWGILSAFENILIHEHELSIIQSPGGTVHDLTTYVMKYISQLSNYEQILTRVIVSKPSYTDMIICGNDLVFSEIEEKTSFASHLIWIIATLQTRLQIKSKKYNNETLAHLFMMNNLYHIFQEIKTDQGLTNIVGHGFLKKLKAKIQREAANYQRAAWKRVLNCLKYVGYRPNRRCVLKERIKTFNSSFEKICRTQTLWLVPAMPLRVELQESTSRLLIQAYRSFIKLYGSLIQKYWPSKTYIKYTDECIEEAVFALFKGTRPSSKY